jgi:hypothetical protein
MSGLSLTSAAVAAITTLRPRDPLGDALPGPPAAVREFAREDTIALFAEVYDNRSSKEPAAPIELKAELRGEGGRVFPIASERRAANAPRRKSGGHGLTARLPLKDVPAGPYVLRVDAREDRDGGHAVNRSISIQVR